GRPSPLYPRQRTCQLLESEPGVARDRDLHGEDPLELRGVDVDLDDACVLREVAAEAGLELLEPAAHDEHRVGFVERPRARTRAIEADQPIREPVVLGDGAATGG